jgi:hypothetical protein
MTVQFRIFFGVTEEKLWVSRASALLFSNILLTASASADENLCIWDFFGTPSKEKKKSRVKTHNSTIFRTYIR